MNRDIRLDMRKEALKTAKEYLEMAISSSQEDRYGTQKLKEILSAIEYEIRFNEGHFKKESN